MAATAQANEKQRDDAKWRAPVIREVNQPNFPSESEEPSPHSETGSLRRGKNLVLAGPFSDVEGLPVL